MHVFTRGASKRINCFSKLLCSSMAAPEHDRLTCNSTRGHFRLLNNGSVVMWLYGSMAASQYRRYWKTTLPWVIKMWQSCHAAGQWQLPQSFKMGLFWVKVSFSSTSAGIWLYYRLMLHLLKSSSTLYMQANAAFHAKVLAYCSLRSKGQLPEQYTGFLEGDFH